MKLAFLSILAFALYAQDPDAAFQHARDLIQQAEKLPPSQVDQVQPKLTQAKTELTALLKLRPDHAPARIELARIDIIHREYPAALDHLQTVLRADPKNLDAQLTRAKALVAMEKPGVARLFLNDALLQYPDHPEVLFSLGQACLADRRFAEAGDAYRKLWKLEPTNVRGLEGFVKSLFGSEQSDAALEVLQSEAAKAPDRPDIQTLLGRVAFQLKKFDLALQAFQSAINKSDKPTAELWGRLAETYQAKGDLHTAITTFRKAHQAGPEEPRISASLAMALDSGGMKEEAITQYRTAITLDPKNGAILNNLAYLLADTGGNLVEALDLAQRAKALMPTNPDVTDTLGWVYLKSKKLDGAIAIFRDLVNRYPSNASFHYHLGLALAEDGDTVRALPELKKALAEGPSQDDLPKIRDLIRKLEGAKR